jgi:hypothetical protein
MKRFIIALAAVIAAFGFTSCEKEAEKIDPIVGTWKATKMEMTMGGMTQEMELSKMGGEIAFTFEKDGKGKVEANLIGETISEVKTYNISGDLLSITFEDETVPSHSISMESI